MRSSFCLVSDSEFCVGPTKVSFYATKGGGGGGAVELLVVGPKSVAIQLHNT